MRLFTPLRRPHRPGRADQAALRAPAGRDLPPRRAEPRARLVRHPRVHLRRHRRRHAAPARGDPRVRRRARASTRRPRREMFGAAPPPQSETTPFHPRSPYAVRQGRRLLGRRSTTARRTACSPATASSSTTSRARRGETFVTRKITRAVARIKHGPAGQALPRQPRRQARLGLRPRLRRGDVADAPGRRARRLRDRHRRDALGARVPRARLRARRPRLGAARRDRPALLPPLRGRRAARRRDARRASSSAGSRRWASRSSCGSWSTPT